MFIPLNWLYLWQIKEYRLDRFRSHLRSLSWKKRIRLFLWGDIRKPTFTPKMVVITFLSIGLSLLLWIYLVEVSSLTVFNAIVMGFISWYCSSVIIT
ncbi:hypothetical protein KC571_02500, partial [candidate division WWE3 bacterium]|nr:hypothetical protein [candidate division WWE3 bacterium]